MLDPEPATPGGTMMVGEVLRHSIQVTAFVAVMMLAVEYVNVLSHGAWPANLAASPWKQYLIAVLLGATPGCMGAFAVVTLYTHRMVSLGALTACMIASSGDESFVMLPCSLAPRWRSERALPSWVRSSEHSPTGGAAPANPAGLPSP